MRETVIPISPAPPPAAAPALMAALRQNVVTVHLLALCPMLAVSVSISAAAALGALTTLVMTLSGGAVAIMRHWIPDVVRLPVLLIIVAALTAALDTGLAALAPALHRELGIFLPLIITNCAVLARLEVFARRQPCAAAMADGAIAGLGMTAALLALAGARAALGAAMPLALMPAGGFILFALMLAAQQKIAKNTPRNR